MLGSIEAFGCQLQEVYDIAAKLKLPVNYRNPARVVVVGMGGSALGAHVIKSVFGKDLKVPFEIVNDYHVPAYADARTLVVCSSYSGTTEEVLTAAAEAKKKKALVLVICAGGALALWAKKNKVPALIFTTNNNPCGSPRMGLGYSVLGQIALLQKAGLVKFSPSDFKKVLATVRKYQKIFGISGPLEKNPARELAQSLLDKSVICVASGHLAGNAHVCVNQLNENAKRFGAYFLIPELNHHLLEGMLFPRSNPKNLAFLFLESKLYDARAQKRYAITKEVLNKNHIAHFSYTCGARTMLEQAFEAIIFSSYFSYYSALGEDIDPTAIPFVDFFKAQLKK